ncbi:MAG: hypothetical protein IPP77_13905 [Bacteroidetes bacterium]|nr:hypothetical protein [Bacteroidota bacterium]
MKANRIELPETIVQQLINLPETGMGYQKMKITLEDGRARKKSPNRVSLSNKYKC